MPTNNKYNGSVRKKLIGIIFISTFITSVLGYSGFVYWFMNNQHEKAINTSNTVSKIISQEAAKLMLLNDVSSASEIMIYLKSFEELNSLVLYKLNKTSILQYSKDDKSFKVDPLPQNITNEIVIRNNKIIKYEKLKLEDSVIGYIQVKFDIYSIYDLLKKDIYTILTILLFIILLTLLLAIYFSKKFTKPIINLVDFLEKISLKDTLRNRIDVQYTDEFGKLNEEVNNMLDRIQESNKVLQENEKILIQQSKMAAMGEMIENIAHQWRQPLSVIAAVSTSIIVKKKIGSKVNVEYEIEKLTKINTTVQYLSETIDDFRKFFKVDKEKVLFDIQDTYKNTFKMIGSRFSLLNIEIIEELNEVKVVNFKNELRQVLINILNNAKDELESKDQKKLIFIKIYSDNNNGIIEITDNAGGVPETIIDKIFDSHFTTKEDTDGTGIGLYMSREMIFKNMGGTIEVHNKVVKFNDIEYKGACFTIKIPL